MILEFLKGLQFIILLNLKNYSMQIKVRKVFFPFLLGDKGYPLLSWLMTPTKEGNHNLLEMLYTRKHKQARSVVENNFGILKKIFHQLKGKI